MTVNTLKKIISRNSEIVGNRLDKRKQLNASSSRSGIVTGEKENIELDSLKQLIPLRNLSEDELVTFSIGGHAEKFNSSVKLFVEDEPVDSILYLLAGTLKIESKNGRGYQISAGTAQSRFPLSSGIKHAISATTMTAVTVLRVSNKIMSVSQQTVDTEIMGDNVHSIVIPSELEDSQLFQAIYQTYTEEPLALSILPPVVDVIRRVMSRDINERQVARIIETDAVLAAKLISVANSPLFLGAGAVWTVIDAVNQLGLKATLNLVQNTCERHLLKTSNHPYLERVQQASAESLLVSGLCFALANWCKTVDPKLAVTAGLLSNIGIMPFAHYVDKFPNQLYEQAEIDMGWPMVRGFMGSFVLEKLGFPKELSRIPTVSENWMYDSGDTLDLADIVIISRLIVHMNEFKAEGLPPIDKIPAVQKLGGKGLSAELSQMLKQAAMKRITKPLAVINKSVVLPK